MILHTPLALVIMLAMALALAGAVRRANVWKRGRPAEVPQFGGLLAAPKRYFVDLHHVVSRDKQSANMHVPVAGGFVASLLLTVAIHVLGVGGTALSWLLVIMLIVMSAGIGLVIRRRFVTRPARLSQKPVWKRLPVGLITFAVGDLLVTLPSLLTGEALNILLLAVFGALVFFGLVELLVGMTWGGAMKHAFAGIFHLAYHPRPDRFGHGKPSSDLKLVDLNAKKWGVETPSDLPWNRLLSFDACVECGRCEAMCPAHAAGQPLSPRDFIQDMLTATVDAHKTPVIGGGIRPETLWSCTTCRACVYECPMMIEHVDTIIDLRRFQTLEKGATPGKGTEVLEDMRATWNPGGHDPERRADWATDLKLPLMAEKKTVDVLFWVGDAAFDLRNQRTLRSVVKLLRAAGVDFAILGTEERDSGDVARRLGDDATFQSIARHNIETLSQYTFNRIVTADPHALHVLGNEYPALGGHYEVLHHTQYLDQLIADGSLKVEGKTSGTVTYHDPCYLGRYNGEIEAPRRLLQALGVETVEMERSGFRSRCCGGGGGAPVTDIPGERRIPDMRMADVAATGAAIVAVACPQCCAMLEGVVQPRAEVRDVAELLAEGLVA